LSKIFTTLDHNFSTRNPSKPSKGSKDSDCSLVSKKNFSKILPSNGLGPGPGEVGQGGLKAEWDSSALPFQQWTCQRSPFRRWTFQRWNMLSFEMLSKCKSPHCRHEACRHKILSSTCPRSFQLCCIDWDSWCLPWIWKCHYFIFVHR